MTKDQSVKKYRFLRIWQVAENEAWFADMSARGLHLHSLGKSFATFKRGEPADFAYSIEPLIGDEAVDQDRLAQFAAAGWEAVATDQKPQMQVYRAPASQSINRADLDESLYQEVLQQRHNSFAKTMVFGTLAAIFYIAFVVNTNPVPIAFIGLASILPILIIGMNIVHEPLDYYYFSRYFRKRQAKEAGSSNEYVGATRLQKVLATLVWSVTVLTISMFGYSFSQEYFPKPLAEVPAYVLTLEDIYENIEYGTDDDLSTSEYTKTTSWRFPAWIKYSQRAVESDSGENVFLRSDVFVANNPNYAKQMVQALQKERLYSIQVMVDYTKQPVNPGFDELYMNEDYTNGVQLLARKGNLVYYKFFFADGEMLLDAFSQKMADMQVD